jgi:hypothetical protein
MGLLDKLFKSSAGDEFGKGSEGAAAGDPPASVQELYGLPFTPASPASPDAGSPTAASPGDMASPPPAPADPPAAAGASSPTPEAAATGPSGNGDPLDSPLRALFTEATTVDPQLLSLLERVEATDAASLALELKEFARAIGVDSAQ